MSIERLAAAAFVAVLAVAPVARAQVMAPMQAPAPDRVELYADAPKVDPGDDPANWSARRNVVDSERYEQLLRTNPAFLQARLRKECGSINEPDLYQQCAATFR